MIQSLFIVDRTGVMVLKGNREISVKGSISPSVNRMSSVVFDSFTHFEGALEGVTENLSGSKPFEDCSYGYYASPTVHALADKINQLEDAYRTLIFPCGLNALILAAQALCSVGDHLICSEGGYPKFKRFLLEEFGPKCGVEITVLDPLLFADSLAKSIKPNTRLIIIENPANALFEVIDLRSVVSNARAHSQEICVLADNTWATPLNHKPLDLGADISMGSGTKYFSGHSDVMSGYLAINEKFYRKVYLAYRNYGVNPSPDDCYLVLRGLRSLPVRIKHHQEVATEVAEYLLASPEVSSVSYPNHPSHPSHNLWREISCGGGGTLSFILKRHWSRSSAKRFIDSLRMFYIGLSYGGFANIAMLYSLKDLRARHAGNEQICIRLYCGMATAKDLINDLRQGFETALSSDQSSRVDEERLIDEVGLGA